MARIIKVARKAWENSEDLIARRNLAFVELYSIIQQRESVRLVKWNNIYFTKTPVVVCDKRTHLIPSKCASALLRWLDGLWALYSQTDIPLNDGVFFRGLNPKRMKTDTEKHIQYLDMYIADSMSLLKSLDGRLREETNTDNYKVVIPDSGWGNKDLLSN